MKFKKWLNTYDTKTLAAKLNITSHCVRTWKRQIATPRLVIAGKLLTLGKGAFTLSDIVRDCTARE